jgi:hypothetical protein
MEIDSLCEGKPLRNDHDWQYLVLTFPSALSEKQGKDHSFVTKYCNNRVTIQFFKFLPKDKTQHHFLRMFSSVDTDNGSLRNELLFKDNS